MVTGSSLLVLGFGLGILHAFDADHIMAISTLVSHRPSVRRSIAFCARWAIGHGTTLLSLGLVVMVFGWGLPEAISRWAERAVGVLLIGLGLWLWWDMHRRRIRLRLHRHGELVHMHLEIDDPLLASVSHPEGSVWHNHSPVLVGILHGLAGSAPVVAVLPALQLGQHWLALAYLLIFSLGVLLSMVVFGVFLGYLQRWLEQYSRWLFHGSRFALGGLAIGMGGYWLTLGH